MSQRLQANSRNVLPFMDPPKESDCKHAIAKALLAIRSTGVSYEKIADELNVNVKTIHNAVAENCHLSFVSVAKIGYHWPDHFGVISELWGRGATAPTLEDHLDRAERALAAIRREVA